MTLDRRLFALALTSCGGFAGSDAPPGDAPLPDAPRGALRVTVLSREGAPVPDHDVFTHDASGTHVAHAVTDADGVATFDSRAHQVSTQVAPWGSAYLITAVGVADRPAITIRPPPAPEVPSEIGSTSVQLPPPPFVDATKYLVTLGSNRIETTMLEFDGVVDDDSIGASGAAYLGAVAVDDYEIPLAWSLFTTGVPVPEAVVFPAWSDQFDGHVYTVWSGSNFDLVDLSFVCFVDDVAVMPTRFDGDTYGGLDVPRVCDSLGVVVAVATPANTSRVFRHVPLPELHVEIDLDEELLPTMQVDSLGDSEPDRPSFTWSSTAPMDAADGCRARLQGGADTIWEVWMAPSATGAFVFPAFPDEHADLRPGAVVDSIDVQCYASLDVSDWTEPFDEESIRLRPPFEMTTRTVRWTAD